MRVPASGFAEVINAGLLDPAVPKLFAAPCWRRAGAVLALVGAVTQELDGRVDEAFRCDGDLVTLG